MENFEIYDRIRKILRPYAPPLRVRVDTPDHFELACSHEKMKEHNLVEAYHFASLVKKDDEVALYFFPIASHAHKFPDIAIGLGRLIREKSCFHFTDLTQELEEDLASLIKAGIDLYTQEGLI